MFQWTDITTAVIKRKQTYLLWFIVILLPWLWLWPKFYHPSFSMVDDAADLLVFRTMDTHFDQWLATAGFHGEIQNGRLRPVYWLLRYGLYYAPFKMNVAGWFAVHYAVLILILTATFFFLRKLTRSHWIAFCACVFWTINAKTMENFTRFATAEVWQLLWTSLGMINFYYLLNVKSLTAKRSLYLPLALIMFGLYFSKETSALLLPFAAVMAIAGRITKQHREEFSVFFLINLSLFTLQRIMMPPMTGYTTAFSLSWQSLLDNLNRYPGRIQWYFVLIVTVFTFMRRLLRQHCWKINGQPGLFLFAWQMVFLILGMIFTGILLFWTQPAPRYLVFPDYFFALFMSIELGTLLQAMTKKILALNFRREKVRKIFLSGSRSLFFLAVLVLAYFSQAEFYWELRYAYGLAGQETPVEALKLFSEKAKPNAKVLYLEVENELVAAAAIYLNDFFDRKDITLYSFSPFAPALQKKGLQIVPLQQNDWPSVLETIDYLYWPHRGSLRAWIDQFHAQMIKPLIFSPYRSAMRPAYESLYFPLPGQLAEGAQIWAIDHDGIRATRLMQELDALQNSPQKNLMSPQPLQKEELS
jgi:hypothetical protein